MRIVALSGSSRPGSFNTALLHAAVAHAPAGVTVEIVDGLDRLPFYDQGLDVGAGPAGVAALRSAIAEADALLVATPEYNGGMPGVLKNALDWASRPYMNSVLLGTPAGVLSAAPTPYGGTWANESARKLLTLNKAVVGESHTVPMAHTKIVDGVVTDEETLAGIRTVLASLVELAASAEPAVA